ncbi:formyltetrahydrofolate deformylase [Duganella sp. FT80W]|uniref:Formyltetrahydrofolate deformylase n=1 Tax=Duganella guangzhouensis TaxID=2666084 RepID=A0A6I2KTZ1_9BURK|nr:formyltetrahydrofolate deformylase [Duganella guangzhouensis]MRW88527.1 formyltetrahydrofolate deformylase [Duganella guangzhouensis]
MTSFNQSETAAASIAAQAEHIVLTLSCPDTIGVVAAVTGFLASHRYSVSEAHHHDDSHSGSSFVRAVFHSVEPQSLPIEELDKLFAEQVGTPFKMRWQFHAQRRKCRVLLAVSRHGHCLNSILHRWSTGTLPIHVVGVVSNHQDMRSLVEWHGVPYYYLPVIEGRKREQEERIKEVFARTEAELLVLARYMQILSDDACRHFDGNAINIHHSFLPGFKGAKAYHQAFERGVKSIGATAHYVTTDLDEGPIIEQGVERVDHTYSPEDLTVTGSELESVVLNRAIKWHAERRVFRNGNKTVVLK